jgi:hypothetical protein
MSMKLVNNTQREFISWVRHRYDVGIHDRTMLQDGMWDQFDLIIKRGIYDEHYASILNIMRHNLKAQFKLYVRNLKNEIKGKL